MPDPQVFEPNDAPTQRFIDGLWDAAMGRADMLAPVFGEGSGGKTLTQDEIDTLWMERHLSVEQEHELWRQGLTPEEIGDAVFKNRQRLMKSGGRREPRQWIPWGNRQADRMNKKQQQAEQPAPSQPLSGESGGY